MGNGNWLTRGVLSVGVAASGVLLAACGPQQTNAAGGGAQGEPIEQRLSALIGAGAPPNFRVWDPFFENAARVRAPSATCPMGSIVLNMGQPRGLDGFLRRPLVDGTGAIDTVTPTTRFPYPIPATSATHTDDHLMRLNDGSFLGLKEGTTIAPLNPEPFWFHELINGGLGIQEGSRGGIHIFNSVCGDSWTLRSIIDWATVAGGVYGVPRPLDANGNLTFDCSQQARDANGRQRWSFAASDRPEFYVCPFTGNVYVTAIVGSGPFCDSNGVQTVAPIDASVLLYSQDNGVTWDRVAQLQRSAPLVMTSTPDGRLFVFGILFNPVTNTFDNPTVQFTQPL